MNKKITIFAIILIIFGIIGTIYFSVSSIPYFVSKVSDIERKMNEENILYNKELDLSKLNIKMDSTNVFIKKNKDNKVKITSKGYENKNRYETKIDKNELYINELQKNEEEFNSISSFIVNLFKENYLNSSKIVTVYLPKDLNIDVHTEYGNVIIEDDVLLDQLKFSTLNGQIDILDELNGLNELNLKSNTSINLSVSEMLGAKEVNIEANQVDIYSYDEDISIGNIPYNVNIDMNDGYISVDSNTPIAKNLNIKAHDSYTKIKLPLQEYKFDFDIKTIEDISLDNLFEQNIIIDKSLINKYNNRIQGNLNKELRSLDTEYKVNIYSNYLEFN